MPAGEGPSRGGGALRSCPEAIRLKTSLTLIRTQTALMGANYLFVCTGNINRSAAAGVILSKHRPSCGVRSCGTGKVAPLGRRIPRKMRLTLEELGYDADSHRSQAISNDLLSWADEIIVMGNVHLRYIADHYPDSLPKVSVWLVDDPHFAKGREKHREVAMQIQHLVLSRLRGPT